MWLWRSGLHFGDLICRADGIDCHLSKAKPKLCSATTSFDESLPVAVIVHRVGWAAATEQP